VAGQKLCQNACSPAADGLAGGRLVDVEFSSHLRQRAPSGHLEVTPALGDGQTLALTVGEQSLVVVGVDDRQEFIPTVARVQGVAERLELLASGGHVERHLAVLDVDGELGRQRGRPEEFVEPPLVDLVLSNRSLVVGVDEVVGEDVGVGPDGLSDPVRAVGTNLAQFQCALVSGDARQQSERCLRVAM